MSQSEVVRNIKIKTNTLKRLHKELSYYQQEKNKEEARVEQMRSQQADAHDLRQAENVLAESAMMVPETRQRLEAALSELQSYLAENQQDAGEAEELKDAQEAIEAAESTLKS